jgi:hypothetical protein
VEWVVANSAGTTEYLINQTIFNITGQFWSGYRFELGFGRGSAFVPASGGLDFDLPVADPAQSASRFPVLSHQAGILEWSGGAYNGFGPAAFSFSIDVPGSGESCRYEPGRRRHAYLAPGADRSGIRSRTRLGRSAAQRRHACCAGLASPAQTLQLRA